MYLKIYLEPVKVFTVLRHFVLTYTFCNNGCGIFSLTYGFRHKYRGGVFIKKTFQGTMESIMRERRGTYTVAVPGALKVTLGNDRQ